MSLAEYQAKVKEQKRQQLLSSAQAAFLSQGFARANVNIIAKDARVSITTLYKHFSSKEALFGAVMASLWQELHGSLEGKELSRYEPREALALVGTEYANLLQGRTIRGLFRVLIAEAEQFPELGRQLYQHSKKPYLDKLEVYLRLQVEVGELDIGNVPLATRQFLGMINDLLFWPRLLIVDFEPNKEDCETVVSEAVETFLKRYR